MPELKNFALVGGTALALKYGHRKSVDLDLFCNEKFDIKIIEDALAKKFGNEFNYEHQNIKWAVFCHIKNIKVDLVHYPHQTIFPTERIDGITMYNTKDIAAMKVNAILGRGVKKDFWDLRELLNEFSIAEIIDFHKAKYPSQMLAISIPTALTYFIDAEESDEPDSLKGQTWIKIKKEISSKVREFFK